jgi:hypothetical protein
VQKVLMTIPKCKATNRNGNQCRNSAVAPHGYCRSHGPEFSVRPSTGRQFEERVLKVLRLLGYRVERDINVNGCQIDLYGEYRTGVIPLRLMVECKDYGQRKRELSSKVGDEGMKRVAYS